MNKLFVIPFLAAGLLLGSCGSSTNDSNQSSTENTETTETTTPVATATVPGIENVTLSNTWTIEGNDQMKFDTELIRVKAGEPVEITLKNVGELPKEAMGHNFIILAPGVDLATFGGEAANAADNDFIPKSALSSILAHTKLLGPGEEDTITVTLEPGVYDYLCSFPGHWGLMKGKIVAE